MTSWIKPLGQMVEILGLMPVSELGPLQTDGAENLLGVAFAPRGYFRSTVLRSPGLMQGRALAKRGFVHIDEDGLLGLGVFLDWDRCNGSTFSGLAGRLGPDGGAVAAPNSPGGGGACAHGPDGKRGPTLPRSLRRRPVRSKPRGSNRRPPGRFPQYRGSVGAGPR